MRERMCAVSVLLCLVLGSGSALAAEGETTSGLLDAMRSDDVPGNAYAALRTLVPDRWGRGVSPFLGDYEAQLVRALDDGDYQLRQYAAYVLLALYQSRLTEDTQDRIQEWPPRLFDVMLEGLRDDEIDGFDGFGNASTFSSFFRANAPLLPPFVIEGLGRLLDSEDHHARQHATYVLIHVYESQNVRVEDWPESMFANLVEGLRDDEIHGFWTFNNHQDFLRFLYELERRRPVERVQGALAGDDAQARFAAACVLAHWFAGTPQPAVSAELVDHLRDDDVTANGFAAYQALVELGPANLEQLLAATKPIDGQQAAWLACLAGYFGLDWTPETRFLEAWYERADTLSVAALYVSPAGKRFLKGRERPEALARIERLGAGLRTAQQRAHWIATYYYLFAGKDGTYRVDWWAPPRPAVRCVGWVPSRNP